VRQVGWGLGECERLISKAASGGSANGDSFAPVFSPDGTELAFYSTASDLGPTDTNNDTDIYVTDLHIGQTSLVSVNDTGTDSANAASGRDVIGDTPFFDPKVTFSPDSTQIAFSSAASDLVPADSNGSTDVFVRDLASATTTLVSVNGSGTDSGNGYSVFPVFSPDGTKVAFTSAASDLGPTNSQATQDIYLRDLTTGVTEIVAPNAPCSVFDFGASEYPSISPDGTMIAFSSQGRLAAPDTNHACDVYVRPMTGQAPHLVSVNADGTNGGDQWSYHPLFSPDSKMVAIYSYATNLVRNDGNKTESDIFVRDLTVNVTTIASANAAHTGTANGSSSDPHFSPDSQKIAFTSAAHDIDTKDTSGDLNVYVATAMPLSP
jgi:Tol biopolymer transport system component